MATLSKDKLNELKRSKNYTASQLAEITGLPKSTIDKIFGGFNTNPTLDSLEKIAMALDCGIDDFLEYEKEPASPFYVDRVSNKMSAVFAENPNLKTLFDVSKKLKDDDIDLLITFARRLA